MRCSTSTCVRHHAYRVYPAQHRQLGAQLPAINCTVLPAISSSIGRRAGAPLQTNGTSPAEKTERRAMSELEQAFQAFQSLLRDRSGLPPLIGARPSLLHASAPP
jgi:hypothetical protein